MLTTPAKPVKQVLKLSGNTEDFSSIKISESIWKAAQKVGGKDKDLSFQLGAEVRTFLEEKYPNGEVIKTTEIGEIVEKVLIEKGHAKTAKAFIIYRENKKHLRQDKSSLGVVDDIGFSYNTLYILKQRYLKRNEKGLFPANMVFLRGACSDIPHLKKYRTWMSINSMPLEIGIAKFSEMENFSFKYPELKGIDVYDNLYEGLNQHIKFAIKTIRKRHRDFRGCYIQFKETDVPGHDNKPHEKKKMIEVIDKDFFGFLREFIDGRDIRVVVTCDHSTPCKLKAHSADPVPVLVYDRKNKDRMTHFNERMAIAGSLGGFVKSRGWATGHYDRYELFNGHGSTHLDPAQRDCLWFWALRDP